MKKEEFQPDWFEGKLPAKSFRSIFKWGGPDEYKRPNKRLYKLMKETFGLDDEYFRHPRLQGFEEVKDEIKPKLSMEIINELEQICGKGQIAADTYTRLSVSYGKTMIDLMRLRRGIVENIPDLVVYPGDKKQVGEIVELCVKNKIPLYVYGGGSSVTRGTEAMKGGITIDTRRNFNKILELNEENQTATVQPGISGPRLENQLQKACQLFGAERNYTCGHFPQSFEYSAVGGWVTTRGAGQNSTYYGKIEDIVLCQEYATPRGIIKTKPFPAKATGPDIDQIMMGGEGAFGVLTEVTLKIKRHQPKNTKYFSYIFPDWEKARNAVREIMQSENGVPSVCRLSDPEETDVALKLYGVEVTPLENIIARAGLKQNRRCLFLGTTDGGKAYSRMVKRNVSKICRKNKGLNTTAYVAKKWEHGRFRDPYLREDLEDFDILIDTLECTVNWANLEHVHQFVRAYCKSRPQTICMTHMSHCYPQGCNLYFIFIGRFAEIGEYLEYHRGILDAIRDSGATMSHHHGIGKMFAPWLPGQIGENEYEIFRTLKKHFDPDNLMNPGGTLGFDLPPEDFR